MLNEIKKYLITDNYKLHIESNKRIIFKLLDILTFDKKKIFDSIDKILTEYVYNPNVENGNMDKNPLYLRSGSYIFNYILYHPSVKNKLLLKRTQDKKYNIHNSYGITITRDALLDYKNLVGLFSGHPIFYILAYPFKRFKIANKTVLFTHKDLLNNEFKNKVSIFMLECDNPEDINFQFKYIEKGSIENFILFLTPNVISKYYIWIN